MSDRQLQVKLSIAEGTGRLDLSDCQLDQLTDGMLSTALTGLEDLTLAGNKLTTLPPELGRLSQLRRLVVAGNQLEELPDEVTQLVHLEGLWAHGNLLHRLPEGLGGMTALRNLSLAGNCLSQVPPGLQRLLKLQELSLAGNDLQQLPEGMLEGLTDLQRLFVHGNQLQQLPGSGWEGLEKLRELSCQGNRLRQVPDGVTRLPAAFEVSFADNQLEELPESLEGGWSEGLQKLHLYGNRLTRLPLGPGGLPSLRLLSSCWLEGNPLERQCVAGLLRLVASGALPSLKALGLDAQQLEGADVALVEAAGSLVKPGEVVEGDGPGYFKLQRAPAAAAAAAAAARLPRVLVVALGSAPGLPNWGGALRQVREAATEDLHGAFDTLFIVDPSRSWYHGGDPEQLHASYYRRLQRAIAGGRYERVVMLGDSMGATAALLLSGLATTVLAFCPQVDLSTSSIRPGRPALWQERLRRALLAEVAASQARLQLYTGTWQHDLRQADQLAQLGNVRHKVFSYDTHRLALVLASRQQLVPILREAILQEMGINSGNVRASNVL